MAKKSSINLGLSQKDTKMVIGGLIIATALYFLFGSKSATNADMGGQNFGMNTGPTGDGWTD
jgi:hypothetical protein